MNDGGQGVQTALGRRLRRFLVLDLSPETGMVVTVQDDAGTSLRSVVENGADTSP
ncbi:hypothetical protein D3C81_1448290 [compost metagenome]